MKIDLLSTNTANYPAIKKSLLLIPREKELLITTKDGKAIASLSIQIMDREEHGNTVPSNSFFLIFEAAHQISSQ